MEARKIDKVSGKGTFWPDEETKPPITLQVVDNRQKKYDIPWFYVYQGTNTGVTMKEQATMKKPLTQTEYRVRDMILDAAGIGNWSIVNQAELARQLRVQRADVSRAIKRLINVGIIEVGKEKMGKNSQYRIAPGFCFKGPMWLGQKEAKEAADIHKAKVTMFQASLLE